MQNKLILGIGIVLVLLGFFKPSFDNINIVPNIPNVSVESYVVDAPADDALLAKAKIVVDILQASDDSARKENSLKLSSLYADLATLIEIDDTPVITDTASIREANSLSGKMLRLNIQSKYPKLAESARDIIATGIGDDDVMLSPELRAKAAESFRALSWACYEGSR